MAYNHHLGELLGRKLIWLISLYLADTGGYYLISREEYDAAIENVKAETGADDLVALSHWDANAERGEYNCLTMQHNMICDKDLLFH